MASEPPRVALVLGGARSGKSAFAERLAQAFGEPVLFVATASAIDQEMAERIEAHRVLRPESWHCLEAPLEVGQALRRHGPGMRTVLLDCLSLLASNYLVGPQHDRLDEADAPAVAEQVRQEVQELLDAAQALGVHLVVVSNEVGMGVVPAYPLGRVYRDLLGRANQQVAEVAEAVYLMVAGIPVDIKRIGATQIEASQLEARPRSLSC